MIKFPGSAAVTFEVDVPADPLDASVAGKKGDLPKKTAAAVMKAAAAAVKKAAAAMKAAALLYPDK